VRLIQLTGELGDVEISHRTGYVVDVEIHVNQTNLYACPTRQTYSLVQHNIGYGYLDTYLSDYPRRFRIHTFAHNFAALIDSKFVLGSTTLVVED